MKYLERKPEAINPIPPPQPLSLQEWHDKCV